MVDFIQYLDFDFDTDKFIKDYRPELFANVNSGEIKYPICYSFGPIDLLVCKDSKGLEYLKIKGSIHKLFNYLKDGKEPFYNYNDFNIQAIEKAINELFSRFDIETHSGFLRTVEFGYNLETSFDPKPFIENEILHHKGRVHSKKNDYRNTGMFIEFDHTEYWFKIYDKGKHYKLDRFILRIELKIKSKRAIQKHGIYTLKDLSKTECLDSLYKYLRDQVNNLFVCSQLEPPEGLNNNQKENYYDHIIPDRYKQLRKRLSRKSACNREERFNELLLQNGLSEKKREVLRLLDSKYKELIKGNEIQSSNYKNVALKVASKNPSRVTDSTKYIVGICYHNPKTYNRRNPEDVPYSDSPHIKKPRNDKSNPRNNLRNRIIDRWCTMKKSMFPDQAITLSKREFEILEYFVGTPYDVFLFIDYLIVRKAK